MFRQRPKSLFFSEAKSRKVGILARVPLASGLLADKFDQNSVFSDNDHRNYNRKGESFDVGETFSGVPFEIGLKAIDELRPLVPAGMTMAQFALRWILMFDAVTCAIPGAKRRDQAEENATAANMPPIDEKKMAKVSEIYDRLIRPEVHHNW